MDGMLLEAASWQQHSDGVGDNPEITAVRPFRALI